MLAAVSSKSYILEEISKFPLYCTYLDLVRKFSCGMDASEGVASALKSTEELCSDLKRTELKLV